MSGSAPARRRCRRVLRPRARRTSTSASSSRATSGSTARDRRHGRGLQLQPTARFGPRLQPGDERLRHPRVADAAECLGHSSSHVLVRVLQPGDERLHRPHVADATEALGHSPSHAVFSSSSRGMSGSTARTSSDWPRSPRSKIIVPSRSVTGLLTKAMSRSKNCGCWMPGPLLMCVSYVHPAQRPCCRTRRRLTLLKLSKSRSAKPATKQSWPFHAKCVTHSASSIFSRIAIPPALSDCTAERS